MKKIIGLVASLTIIAGICSAVLAYVNEKTAEPIKATAAANEKLAVASVLPDGVVAIEAMDGYSVGKDGEGKIMGYAAKGKSDKGYGGDIVLMVGFAADKKTLVGYKTLVASETPGLGMKLNSPEFKDQFPGKDATKLRLTKSGGEIEAITAATITSKAVLKAIADAQAKIF